MQKNYFICKHLFTRVVIFTSVVIYVIIFTSVCLTADTDIKCSDIQYRLGSIITVVTTDKAKADRISAYVKKNTSAEVRRHISAALRSGNPNKENIVYGFLKILFMHGIKAAEMLNFPKVSDFFTGSFTDDELLFTRMCKQYYKSINIENRLKKKLQNRCMPLRYRSFMEETH